MSATNNQIAAMLLVLAFGYEFDEYGVMPVRNKIKHLCDSRDMTPYRFYKSVGLAPKTGYDLYNKPEQLPSSTVLSKICDCFEVQPNDVLEWVKLEKKETDDV